MFAVLKILYSVPIGSNMVRKGRCFPEKRRNFGLSHELRCCGFQLPSELRLQIVAITVIIICPFSMFPARGRTAPKRTLRSNLLKLFFLSLGGYTSDAASYSQNFSITVSSLLGKISEPIPANPATSNGAEASAAPVLGTLKTGRKG